MNSPARPRISADRERELLGSAMETLAEVGYDSLSMDLIAAKAQCSKATLYRRWQGKSDMVVAAISSVGPPPFEGINTGSLRGDLVTMVRRISEGAEHGARFAAAIHHAMMVDPDLAEVVHASLFAPQAQFLELVIERAVQRGELKKRPSTAQFLPHMIFSALMTGPLSRTVEEQPAFAISIIDAIIVPALQREPPGSVIFDK